MEQRDKHTDVDPSLVVTVTDTQQPYLTFIVLNSLRKQQKLCDLEIRIGQAKFFCHQVIVGASSPLLMKLVSSKPLAASYITLSDTNLQVFAVEMLIDFMYTSVMTISSATVKPVCYAAKQLKLVRAESTCCKFILRSIKRDSPVSVSMDYLTFALTNKYTSIQAKCVKHITKNLASLSSNTHFLNLTADKILQVLQLFDPSSVAEMLTMWVDHDRQTRQKFLQLLIRNLNINIPNNYDGETLKPKPDNPSIPLIESTKPPSGTTPRVIYVAGGNTDTSITAEVEMYNPAKGAWTVAPDLLHKKSHCSLVSGSGQLYLIGGFDGLKRTSSMEIYNPALDTWISGPNLCYRRSGCGSVVFRGEIYTVGGYDGVKHLSSVEVYNLKQKMWSNGPSLNHARSYVQLAVMDGNLYAVGGADDNGRFSSVEILSDPHNQWMTGPSLSVPRSRPGVVTVSNQLFVCGGYDGYNYLSSIETLDDGNWTIVANMSTPRNSPGVCAIGSDLYIFGGYNGRQFLDTMEIYHTATNTWSMGSPMTTSRCDFGYTTCLASVPSISL